MPHDRNGKLIEVGDHVTLRCKVKSVQIGEEYCNLTVETCEPMFPTDRRDSYTLNAKQVEVVSKGPGYAAPSAAVALLLLLGLALGGCATDLVVESDNTAYGKQSFRTSAESRYPHPMAERASKRVTTRADGSVETECGTCEGGTCAAK